MVKISFDEQVFRKLFTVHVSIQVVFGVFIHKKGFVLFFHQQIDNINSWTMTSCQLSIFSWSVGNEAKTTKNGVFLLFQIQKLLNIM